MRHYFSILILISAFIAVGCGSSEKVQEHELDHVKDSVNMINKDSIKESKDVEDNIDSIKEESDQLTQDINKLSKEVQ